MPEQTIHDKIITVVSMLKTAIDYELTMAVFHEGNAVMLSVIP